MVTRGGPWKVTDSHTICLSRKLSTVCASIGLFLHSNARGEKDMWLVFSPERTGDGDVARHPSVGLLCGPSSVSLHGPVGG